MMTKNITFGGLYHELRTNQGKTLNDVRQILSCATVSNFETGKSEISLNNFEILLESLDLSLSDFFEIYENAKSSIRDRDINFTKSFKQLLWSNDLNFSSSLVKQLEHHYENTEYVADYLMAAVAKATLVEQLTGYAILSKSDAKCLEDFLIHKEFWYKQDYELFACSAFYLPKDNLLKIYHHFIVVCFSLRCKKVSNDLIFGALIATALALLKFNDLEQVISVLEHLSQFTTIDTPFYLKSLEYLANQLYLYKSDLNSVALEELNQTIKSITRISPNLANKLSQLKKACL